LRAARSFSPESFRFFFAAEETEPSSARVEALLSGSAAGGGFGFSFTAGALTGAAAAGATGFAAGADATGAGAGTTGFDAGDGATAAGDGTMGFDNFTRVAGYDKSYGRSEYNNDKDFDGDW
jgi:hypothetical protein